jgi:hypothetical protein
MSCSEDILGNPSIQCWPTLNRDRTPEECFLDPKVTCLALDTTDTFVARFMTTASEVVNYSESVSGQVQPGQREVLTCRTAL